MKLHDFDSVEIIEHPNHPQTLPAEEIAHKSEWVLRQATSEAPHFVRIIFTATSEKPHPHQGAVEVILKDQSALEFDIWWPHDRSRSEDKILFSRVRVELSSGQPQLIRVK